MTQDDREKVARLEGLMASLHRVSSTIKMKVDHRADTAVVLARLEEHEAALRRDLAAFSY